MLLKETKLRLLDLFTSFAEEEKDLEQLRQNLCETACFEPYIAFRRIDSSNLGFLSTSNLLEFLSSYNFFHNHQNIQFYINHYDQDYDKKLSYSEFLQSVLPLDNSELRFSISQRPIKKLEDFNEGIIQKIEKKLAFLINREINFYIKFEKEKLNLISYSNFDIFHIFQSLALRDREEIGFEDLKVFFFKNSFEIKDNDILLILRRIDLNGDGKIEFHEFENAFLPKTKFVKEKENKDLNQPKGGRIQNFQTSRQFEDKRDFFSKSFNVTSNSKMFNFKNIGFNEHIQSVLGIFNYYLKIEKIYEDLKQELAMREDFNLFDLFNCFDKLGQGFILTSELEYRLNDIQMHPDKNELLAFINILNLKVEGKIKFSNLIGAFLPKQLEYANILNKRAPKNENLSFVELFNKTTREMIRKIIENHFENELFLEKIKSKILGNLSFNIEKVFDFLDYDNDGFLSMHDLRRLFDKANLILTEKQLLLLLERFDKDEDSLISFYEFDAELQPKIQENS